MPCNVAVVGAGLVGCLQACYLANRGHNVVIFDKREDLRKISVGAAGRSINLALSHRGRSSLRRAGLEDAVLGAGVPVYGRMVHSIDGKQTAMPYGVLPDQFNYAIDRRRLNCLLLDTIEQKGVTICFQHCLTSASFSDDRVTLMFVNAQREEITNDEFDFVFACDGAHSALRARIIETSCTNFEMKYIEHGYRELMIAPTPEGKPALEYNYLHLWARGNFMFMGLPNPDNSFTGTLFMPMKMFDSIQNADQLIEFFESNFPDAMDLVGGRSGLLEQYKVTKSRPGKLPCVRVSPHHCADGRVLLMGDAAHAMVPFYAQGMNCGFEDCEVLDEAIDAELERSGENSVTKDVMRNAIVNYSNRRVIDCKAICDLAEYNYIEMRHLVNVWWYRWRKSFDYTLYRLLGASGGWVPLYISVSYTRMPYDACRRHRAWQDAILHRVRMGLMVAAGAVVAGYLYRPIVKNLQIRWGAIRIFN